MKLKFRADAEDLMMFGIFAVFLLYIVAIYERAQGFVVKILVLHVLFCH